VDREQLIGLALERVEYRFGDEIARVDDPIGGPDRSRQRPAEFVLALGVGVRDEGKHGRRSVADA